MAHYQVIDNFVFNACYLLENIRYDQSQTNDDLKTDVRLLTIMADELNKSINRWNKTHPTDIIKLESIIYTAMRELGIQDKTVEEAYFTPIEEARKRGNEQ